MNRSSNTRHGKSGFSLEFLEREIEKTVCVCTFRKINTLRGIVFSTEYTQHPIRCDYKSQLFSNLYNRPPSGRPSLSSWAVSPGSFTRPFIKYPLSGRLSQSKDVKISYYCLSPFLFPPLSLHFLLNNTVILFFLSYCIILDITDKQLCLFLWLVITSNIMPFSAAVTMVTQQTMPLCAIELSQYHIVTTRSSQISVFIQYSLNTTKVLYTGKRKKAETDKWRNDKDTYWHI